MNLHHSDVAPADTGDRQFTCPHTGLPLETPTLPGERCRCGHGVLLHLGLDNGEWVEHWQNYIGGPHEYTDADGTHRHVDYVHVLDDPHGWYGGRIDHPPGQPCTGLATDELRTPIPKVAS